jgi:hypothetical protein
LQAVHQPAGITFKLCESAAGVALRAYGSGGAGVAVQVAIDDLKVRRVLVQAYFEIEDWRATCAAELFPELDVEDAVGRSARYRGEYPLPVDGVSIVQIVPVRGDQVIHDGGGQAAVGESSAAADELQVAVR